METKTAKEALHVRIQKVIGQCNGISRMIDRDAPCKDILFQIGAVKYAMHEVAQQLLEAYIETSAQEGLEKNDIKKMVAQFQEAMRYLGRMHR